MNTLATKRKQTRAIRWSDNDRYWGPFTYASGDYDNLAVTIASGDNDDYPGCRLRLSAFRRTLILALPPIIKPEARKVEVPKWRTDGTAERLGRDYYFDYSEREYGFICSEGHLSVHFGRQTNDSTTEQRWGCFLPWTQWRHIRHSLYDLTGDLFADLPEWGLRHKNGHAVRVAIEAACPTATFAFKDYDGEELTARTRVEEREWRFGEGWFKWLSLFRANKVSRSLDIHFSGETGDRKGSWKGGTIGHSIEMLSGELHEAAFRRYCAKHSMTFIGARDAILSKEKQTP